MKKKKDEYRMTDYVDDMCFEYFKALKERRKSMKNFLLGGLVLYTIGATYILINGGVHRVRSR